MNMQISERGLALLKSFEGFRPEPYLDQGLTPTIGYGTIMYPNCVRVSMADPAITEAQALGFLELNVNQKTSHLCRLILVPVSQSQFDAICCLAYNIGLGAFEKSTLLALLNKGDFAGAADEFLKWDKVDGHVVEGLLNRRQKERELFLSGSV